MGLKWQREEQLGVPIQGPMRPLRLKRQEAEGRAGGSAYLRTYETAALKEAVGDLAQHVVQQIH
jgi:hypothetical protein